jgi:hypothetical protein
MSTIPKPSGPDVDIGMQNSPRIAEVASAKDVKGINFW